MDNGLHQNLPTFHCHVNVTCDKCKAPLSIHWADSRSSRGVNVSPSKDVISDQNPALLQEASNRGLRRLLHWSAGETLITLSWDLLEVTVLSREREAFLIFVVFNRSLVPSLGFFSSLSKSDTAQGGFRRWCVACFFFVRVELNPFLYEQLCE